MTQASVPEPGPGPLMQFVTWLFPDIPDHGPYLLGPCLADPESWLDAEPEAGQ